MSANRIGERFCVTTFGESHGPALGVVIDGCPAGVSISLDEIQCDMDRRKPGGGNSSVVSGRNEPDKIEILSGIFEGRTLGTPIAIIVRNEDARSEDYEKIRVNPRIGHTDDLWMKKFNHFDHRGGGRSSGRETLARVMAGSIAKVFVKSQFSKCDVMGFVSDLGSFSLSEGEIQALFTSANIKSADIDNFRARFPSARHEELHQLLMEAKSKGESYGGAVSLIIKDPPSLLGQPVFHKLKSDIAMGLMSIGAAVGVEFGSGFKSVAQAGTSFHSSSKGENNFSQYGGIRGGISTGETMFWKVAFKPTSSILDIAKLGRHDPAIVVRAVPVCEAMLWIIFAEHILWARSDRS